MPVVRARVDRVRSAARAAGRHVPADCDDLTQEVFAHLFSDDARVLRGWNPTLGASLKNHVGLVAERRVRSLLRSGRWSGWREQPTATSDLESHASTVDSPAQRTAAVLAFERILGGASARLTPQGRKMMELFFVEGRTVAEVQTLTGMKRSALYAWRSRLQKLIRALAQDLRVTDRSFAPS